MCSWPLPRSSGKLPPSGSATRSRPPSGRACGSEAPCPSATRLKDGKIAIVEEEAELVRWIFRRNLELGSVNELVRDLKERNIRTRAKRLATGATLGGIPFG